MTCGVVSRLTIRLFRIAYSLLEKACEYHSKVFFRKEIENLDGRKLALSSVASQSHYVLHVCTKINILGLHALQQTTFKMASFIKAVGVNVPLIELAVVESSKKLRHCGPVCYKMFYGVDLCANHGDTLSEYRASLTDKERIKRNSIFSTGCRQSFSKVFTCISVENSMQIPMVRVGKLKKWYLE